MIAVICSVANAHVASRIASHPPCDGSSRRAKGNINSDSQVRSRIGWRGQPAHERLRHPAKHEAAQRVGEPMHATTKLINEPRHHTRTKRSHQRSDHGHHRGPHRASHE